MALKTYKKAGEYKVISRHDDALDLQGTDEEKHKQWEVACETGNWQAIIKAGSKPVVFTLRPLGTETMSLWRACKRGGVLICETEHGWTLLGRMAVIKIEGDGDLRFVPDQDEDFGTVCASAPFDLLGSSASRAIQFELGQAVLHRETVTLGK